MDQLSSKRYFLLLTGFLCALILLSLITMCLGRYSMNPLDVFWVIKETFSGSVPADAAMHDVLYIIRLPRIFAAILVGGALSLSGAVYQGVFKNPLVSPDLLGVSSGACVGAAVAILLGGSMVMIQLSAFAMGMLAVGISITITRLLRNDSNMALVLAGIITGGFMASLLGVLKYIADPETQLAGIVFWQMGSVAAVNRGQIVAVSPLFIICGVLLL